MTTATVALTELEGHAELKSLMVEAHLPLLFPSPVHSIFGCAALDARIDQHRLPLAAGAAVNRQQTLDEQVSRVQLDEGAICGRNRIVSKPEPERSVA